MVAIALIGVILAFAQNLPMFTFGLKESAMLSSPLPFAGILLVEVAFIAGGQLYVRRYVRRRQRLVLAAWMIAVLSGAELVLPVSSVSTLAHRAQRGRALSRIELVNASTEALPGEDGDKQFALTYALKFAQPGHYLTYPAWLGPRDSRLFGEYVTELNPEYYDADYTFDAGRPYSFRVVFHIRNHSLDFARETAKIDICDGKDYFMVCRIITIGLARAPVAPGSPPSRNSRTRR